MSARTAKALSIAASFASGLKANFGTMTKPLHVGHCSRNGLFAALIAEGGFEAADDVFEHKQGFLDVFNGPGNYDSKRCSRTGARPGRSKRRQSASSSFPAAAARIRPSSWCWSCATRRPSAQRTLRRLRSAARPAPAPHQHAASADAARTPSSASSTAVARALTDGAVRLKDFEGEADLNPGSAGCSLSPRRDRIPKCRTTPTISGAPR